MNGGKPRSLRRCRALGIVGLAAAAVAAASCGDDAAATTTPSVPRTTESFSGTVQVGGSAFHSFRVAATGITEVTLTSAAPPSTVVMGLAIGTVDDAGCTRLVGAAVNTPAGATPQLAGLTTSGSLCVQIRDVGNQAGAVTYSVSVTHP
jgi:hypothetical protein